MQIESITEHAHTLKYLAYSGFGFGSVSGMWTWVDENAGAIGATCSIVGLGMGMVFGVMNYRLNSRKE